MALIRALVRINAVRRLVISTVGVIGSFYFLVERAALLEHYLLMFRLTLGQSNVDALFNIQQLLLLLALLVRHFVSLSPVDEEYLFLCILQKIVDVPAGEDYTSLVLLFFI